MSLRRRRTADSQPTVAEAKSDFVVVANRLPIDMERLPDGTTTCKRSPGGLVTALEPLLRRAARRVDRLAGYHRTATRNPSSRTTSRCVR